MNIPSCIIITRDPNCSDCDSIDPDIPREIYIPAPCSATCNLNDEPAMELPTELPLTSLKRWVSEDCTDDDVIKRSSVAPSRPRRKTERYTKVERKGRLASVCVLNDNLALTRTMSNSSAPPSMPRRKTSNPNLLGLTSGPCGDDRGSNFRYVMPPAS